MNDTSGINEVKIDELALKLYDLIEQMQLKFNRIDELTNDSKQFAKGEVADAYYKKYNGLSDNFSIVISNLTTYISDVIRVKYFFVNTMNDAMNETIAKSINTIEEYEIL